MVGGHFEELESAIGIGFYLGEKIRGFFAGILNGLTVQVDGRTAHARDGHGKLATRIVDLASLKNSLTVELDRRSACRTDIREIDGR